MNTSRNPRLVVSGIIYNTDNQVLLFKSPKWNNKWTIPGGDVDWGETLEQAVRCEIIEETRLNVGRVSFIDIDENIFDLAYKNGTSHFVSV